MASLSRDPTRLAIGEADDVSEDSVETQLLESPSSSLSLFPTQRNSVVDLTGGDGHR